MYKLTYYPNPFIEITITADTFEQLHNKLEFIKIHYGLTEKAISYYKKENIRMLSIFGIEGWY